MTIACTEALGEAVHRDLSADVRLREQTEIRCLRAFYDAWAEFQVLRADDRSGRGAQKNAARRVMCAREAVMRFDAMYSQMPTSPGIGDAPGGSACEISGNSNA